MSIGKSSRTLFEAMSRAPQVTTQRPAPGLLNGFSKRRTPSAPMVAQALTEQEAREEMAAREARESERRRAAEARSAERDARRAEKAARKAQLKAERAAGHTDLPRLSFSLSTAGCVGVAGLICALVLAAYSLGRHSREELGALGTVAARGAKDASDSGKSAALKKPPISETVKSKIPAGAHPDLAELLKKPESASSKSVKVNEPVTLSGSDQPAAAALPEDLNYLQIESFLVTRERNSDQLGADLAHVRKFLGDRGVRTFARKRSNGYVLFCEQGVAPDKEHAGQREELKKKIQQLGREYRAGGGMYQFKGSLFVSYSSTKSGDPV